MLFFGKKRRDYLNIPSSFYFVVVFSEDLAEVCGIHVGDGYLRNDGRRRELDISGSFEESGYYDFHVKPLFEKVFGITLKNRIFPSRGTYGFVIRDRDIIRFFHDLGFPYGKKSTTVKIPSFVLKSNDALIHTRFLRGLFDTDGYLGFRKCYGNYTLFKVSRHHYPQIQLTTVSPYLSKQIILLLGRLGLAHYCYRDEPSGVGENVAYRIMLNGVSRLHQWMELIGMKNEVKRSRYVVWKAFGFCPTNLTFEQRKGILNGDIDPYTMGP